MANKPQVTLEFAGDADKLLREMHRVDRAADTMGKNVSAASDDMAKKSGRASNAMKTALAAGAAGIATAAVVGIQKLVDIGKNLEAMDAKARTVFEGQLPAVQAWAEANRRAFGLSSREVVGLAANMTDLLKPLGFTAKQATTMSQKTLDLAGALARWSGGTRTAAEVSDILSDAMLGEMDALKGLGISIGAADVQARLALKGQQDLEGAARAQAEAIAVQELILEKSTDAQKAWADGGKAAAEAQNALSSNMAESTEKLAAIVAPFYEKLVSLLAQVVDWISRNQELATWIGVVTAAVWLLNVALNANPIILIISLIAGLVVGFIALWNKSESFRNFWKGLWRDLKPSVEVIIAIVGAVGRAIGWVIRQIESLTKKARAAWDLAREVMGMGSGWSTAGDGGTWNNPNRHHTGGVVTGGIQGQEVLRILQVGERVIPRGQSGNSGSSAVARVSPGTDGAVATMIMALQRDGLLEFVVEG